MEWTPPVPLEQSGSRTIGVRLRFSQNLGRSNPKGKNSWFEHPDGHPDAKSPNIPAHHGEGHVHSVNPKGEEKIFTWGGSWGLD